MSDLLDSIKADLTSRRMRPLLVLAGVALLAAIGYVALAGKSGGNSAPSSNSSLVAHVPPVPGPTVASAPANPNAAVSETTAGVNYQHGGKMRDPFAPLKSKSSKPASSAAKSSAGASSASSGQSGSSSESSGGSPSGSSGGSPSSGETSKPSPPSTSIALYHVDVTLQRLSEEGKPVGEAQVFHNVSTLQPLPSKHKHLLAPKGVADGGQGVVFVLMTEAILHGSASCVPNAGDCEAIEVHLHGSEELQYQQEDGSVTAYRLTVTKIEKVSSAGGSASTASVRGSAAGRALIAKMHLSIPDSAAFGGPLGTIVGAARR
jgi:hypothetical protein